MFQDLVGHLPNLWVVKTTVSRHDKDKSEDIQVGAPVFNVVVAVQPPREEKTRPVDTPLNCCSTSCGCYALVRDKKLNTRFGKNSTLKHLFPLILTMKGVVK